MSKYFIDGDAVDEWHLQRRGKFTSSSNYILLKRGDSGKPFMAGGYAHIESKAVDMVTKMWARPELEEVESLRHGKVGELPAAQRYVLETKNNGMTLLGTDNPLFLVDNTNPDEAGGSPDMVNIASGDTIDYGAEIKNPFNPAVHYKRLKWKDQFDIKENMIAYYTQIQDLIRITGAFGWDFISFDDRQLYKSKQIKIIQVKPDINFINNLELRIKMAIKEKYKSISEHLGEEVTNRQSFLNLIK